MKIIFIILFALFWAISVQAAELAPYKDSAGTVMRLANEESHPFLFYGEKVGVGRYSNKSQNWNGHKYRSSVREFSSVLDCLERAERKKEKPDLTKVDWRAIDNDKDAAVCLFRIASCYMTPNDMESWMKAQGFTVNKGYVGVKKRLAFNGNWDAKKNGVLFSSNWFVWLYMKLIVYSTSFGLTYDKDSTVYHAGVTQNSL